MPILHSLKAKLVGKVIQGMNFEKMIPKVFEGSEQVTKTGQIAKDFGITRPLVVTDSMLVEIGLIDSCLESLRAEGFDIQLYDKVTPDPTLEQVVEGAKMYTDGSCDGIIAFGGGSSMDCAKVIGSYITNPKPIEEFKKPGSVTKPIPTLICIPTTAGTGSETTLGAVIRDEAAGIKFTVVSPHLVPKASILDPELLRNLPKPITAATGMDAMTHAVEAYTGTWASPAGLAYAERAVVSLVKYLERSYDDGSDMEARVAVMKAAFEAGVAISMGGVGYVHAIAHQLGGKFHTPHGVANAMVMPKVLDYYVEGNSCPFAIERLARLGELAGLGDRSKQADLTLAHAFIGKLREMNAHMQLPSSVEGMKRNDVSTIATLALTEAHGARYNILWNPLLWLSDGGYPTPKYLNQPQCERIVRSLLEDQSQSRARL